MSAGLTLVGAWTAARRALEAAGTDVPIHEARLIVEAAAEVSRLDIVTDPHRPLSAAHAARLGAILDRRRAREPLAYILGRQGFWTFDLAVTPDVLIPRADTETVVHAALSLAPAETAMQVLDLGVGSGAILLAILAERPLAQGLGLDASPAALAVAAGNAARLGLGARTAFLEGDWGADVAGRYDLIVSNPPYIVAEELAGLQPEVRQEPRLALDGGPDGLAAYRRILPQIAQLLAPGGGFAVETGLGQVNAVAALADAAGLRDLQVMKDLSGRERVVYGRAGARTRGG